MVGNLHVKASIDLLSDAIHVVLAGAFVDKVPEQVI
jgi:hypothetical protein